LLQRPDELARVRAQPALVKGAVEEMLRFDTSVQANFRVLGTALDTEGLRIPPGERVMIVIGAANRDPDRFPDPDRFEVDRADVAHLSFGFGAYYCVGAALARAEAQVAVATLLTRFPSLRLADAPRWRPGWLSRGLTGLPVSW
jgi:cytochrome P450